jgi:hypothetical protein
MALRISIVQIRYALAYNSRSGGPLMVAQWLRYCATNQKVTGSIPGGVIGILH